MMGKKKLGRKVVSVGGKKVVKNLEGEEVHVLKGKRKPVIPSETSIPAPRVDPLAKQDRLTVLMTIHHEHRGEPAQSITANSSRMLDSLEQPVPPRRFTIENKDTPLDVGWVKKVGMVVIENRMGKGMLRTPTKEETAELNKQLLYVRFKGAKHGQVIHPGCAIPFYPEDASSVILRAADDPVSCLITVYPS